MAELDVQNVGVSGLVPTYSGLTAGTFDTSPPAFPHDDGPLLGGDTFLYTHNIFASIRNDSGGEVTVTFAGQTPCNQEHVHHTYIAIADGDEALVSSFPDNLLDTTNHIQVAVTDPPGATGVTIAIYKPTL